MKRVSPITMQIQSQPTSNRGMHLQQSYAVEIPLQESEHKVYESVLNCLGDFLGFWGSIPGCFCCPCSNHFMTVSQGNVGLVSRFGKFFKSVDPGLYKINLLSERLQRVDIKIKIEDIPRQFIMTKDNVNVSIDSVLYWRIIDPYVATFLVQDVQKALVERTQTTLRHILGTRTLQDCIENRDTIAQEIQNIIEVPAATWGVDIESILIKDLQFSADLMETLSSAAKSKRIGESKVITAQAEVEAAKLMREASDILNTPAAMQIRYLETLTNMARTAGAKVIFMPGSSDGKMSIEKATILEHMGK